MLDLTEREVGDVFVLDLSGAAGGGPESEKMYEWVCDKLESRKSKLLFNLESLRWANSTGVGVIVTSFASARRRDAMLKFCCATRRVELVLKAHGLLPDVIELYPTEDAALRSFA